MKNPVTCFSEAQLKFKISQFFGLNERLKVEDVFDFINRVHLEHDHIIPFYAQELIRNLEYHNEMRIPQSPKRLNYEIAFAFDYFNAYTIYSQRELADKLIKIFKIYENIIN